MSSSPQFISVATMISGRFRMVESQDSPQFCSGMGFAGNANLREELLAARPASDPVVRWLMEIDRKLDSILGHLQRNSLEKDFPHEGRIVRLSGDGLVLECPQPLAPGDHMELLMFLEEYPMRVASVLGKVQGRAKAKVRTGSDNNAFVLSYDCVREEDREAIIRFVFSEQRKNIRRRKEEEESEGSAE